MAKKKENNLRPSIKGTFKDLQRQAVILGMPFPDVLIKDFYGLTSFIESSHISKPDPSLINKYDEWLDKQFEARGISINDPVRSNRLRLGYLGDEEEKDTNKPKKLKAEFARVPKIGPKAPRKKDSNGLVSGTKKSYTWELAQKGYDLQRVIRRVLKKYPEANTKSIALWYRNCINHGKDSKE